MKKSKLLLFFLGVLLIGCFAVVGIMWLVGKYSLRRASQNGEDAALQAMWLDGKEKTYRYRDDLLIFYIMGIDKGNEIENRDKVKGGGQSDANFLVVLDPKDTSISIFSINRNAMTPIDIYDEEGNYVMAIDAQLAAQHNFGDGMEQSCEYQVKAMQSLMHGIPIHGYCAVNMAAIGAINDQVGGIDVTVLEDITVILSDVLVAQFHEGENVHLMGNDAYWYLKYRDYEIFGTSDKRVERQRQYLNSFIPKAKAVMKSDVLFPIRMYQAIREEIVTDISLTESVYLATQIRKYSFEEGRFYYLPGETVMGDKYEEFYVDEEALQQMILNVFCEQDV